MPALRIACEDRLRLVAEHTAKLNELLAALKTYYPAMIGFFGEFDSRISLTFLLEFPMQSLPVRAVWGGSYRVQRAKGGRYALPHDTVNVRALSRYSRGRLGAGRAVGAMTCTIRAKADGFRARGDVLHSPQLLLYAC